MATLAHASTLLGSQVTLTGDYQTLGTAFTVPNTQTVGSGVEYPAGSIVPLPGFVVFPVNIDVGATTIDFAYTGSGTVPTVSFDGYVFDFTGAPVITGVSLDPSSNINSSDVVLGFGSADVTVNVEGLSVTPSSTILLDLTLATSTSAVPEPSSLLLLGTGLLAVGGFARRKKIS